MTQTPITLAPDPFNPRHIAIGIIAGLAAMGLLAIVVINQFRAVQLRDARDIGSAYIQGFLGPYALEAHAAGELSVISRTELMRLVGDLASARRFVAIRMRAADGAIMFASDSAAEALAESPDEFMLAIDGMAVAEIHRPDGAAGFPEVEIYAPIYDPASNKLIAVGEIYQDARFLLAERTQFERRVWSAVGLATLGFLAMMYLVARQHRQLIAQLKLQRDIAEQNRQLREAAETAWRNSSASNEALLNQLGAELHDGPVQMLSLLALTAPAAGDKAGTAPQAIARDVLADLRRISAGLILPELGALSPRETLMLAVSRHGSATGTDVAVDLGVLPETLDHQRKTCLYRIVQEGLNNALRHGGGNGQAVAARLEAAVLHVDVKDAGHRPIAPRDRAVREKDTGLGLIGLRNRLRVFGGAADARRMDSGGFILSATLPLG